MLLNQLLGFRNLFRLEPVIRVEFNGRFDPELCFTVSMLDMYMRPTFSPISGNERSLTISIQTGRNGAHAVAAG